MAYKRITKTIWEEIEELEAKTGSRVGCHDHDDDLVQIPMGHLRELEESVVYCEMALPHLKKLNQIRRLLNPKITSIFHAEESVLYVNLEEHLQYLEHLSTKGTDNGRDATGDGGSSGGNDKEL